MGGGGMDHLVQESRLNSKMTPKNVVKSRFFSNILNCEPLLQ
jgi:hypothetical protein